MNIKLDENLPATLAQALRAMGHDADTVPEEALAGHIDTDVWQAAQRERRFLVTQDLDFSDVRLFRPGTHAGVMLVRLSEPSRARLEARVGEAFTSAEAARFPGAFVVVTDRKLRVRIAPVA
jgi:predicted nuclease of predicted toxin-antitoxin system